MEFVIAKKVGRVPSVTFRLVSVKFLTAPAMDVASKVNAIVNVAGKDHSVINVSIMFFICFYLILFFSWDFFWISS